MNVRFKGSAIRVQGGCLDVIVGDSPTEGVAFQLGETEVRIYPRQLKRGGALVYLGGVSIQDPLKFRWSGENSQPLTGALANFSGFVFWDADFSIGGDLLHVRSLHLIPSAKEVWGKAQYDSPEQFFLLVKGVKR